MFGLSFLSLTIWCILSLSSSSSLGDFEGKTAFITGGATGIGFAATKEFYNACANVVMASRNTTHGELAQQAIAKLPKPSCSKQPQVVFKKLDIRNSSTIKNAIAESDTQFGSVDVFVNNAGISGVQATITEMQEDWIMSEHDAMMTNLYGTFRAMREELKYFDQIQHKSAVIVNVASVLGEQGVARGSMYSAAKHGIIGLTKSIALERSQPSNSSVAVRINAVAPGAIDTAMLRNSLVRPPLGLENWQCFVDGKISDGPCPDIAENDPQWIKLEKEISPEVNPIGRIATPEEVGSLIFWLASPGASFLQGTVVNVDGGLFAQM